MKTKATNNLTDHISEVANGIRSAGDESEIADIVRWSEAEIQERINAERLEAAGRLAAWLSHQINNPLGTISGNAQLLAKRLERDISDPAQLESYHRYVDGIRSQIERCTQITSELLEFTRPRDVDLRSIDIGDAIEEAVQLASYGRSSGKVQILPGDDLALVRADKELLTRVIFEVLMNAVHATPEDGCVTVKVVAGEQPGTAKVIVSDTGAGISDEVLPRVFEPFFSTREKARGLGLTKCLSMMKQLSGSIEISETSPSGTTVTISVGGSR